MKEGNVLFNDTLSTFYLRLNTVRHKVNHHSDSERGNPLPPHGLLFLITTELHFAPICLGYYCVYMYRSCSYVRNGPTTNQN